MRSKDIEFTVVKLNRCLVGGGAKVKSGVGKTKSCLVRCDRTVMLSTGELSTTSTAFLAKIISGVHYLFA